MVTEFCYRGTLKDVLAQEKFLEMAVMLGFIFDILEGLNAIHESNFGNHGRLRSTVCYVTARYTVKVGGLPMPFTWAMEQTEAPESDIYSELRWSAPEVLDVVLNRRRLKRLDASHLLVDSEILKKSDVYSVGIIIHEVLMLRGPFPKKLESGERADAKTIVKGVQRRNATFKPDMSDQVSEKEVRLISKCIEFDHQKRPTVSQLLRQFQLQFIGKSKLEFLDELQKKYVVMIDAKNKKRERIKAELDQLPSKLLQAALDNIMHPKIMRELSETGKISPKLHQNVTVLFSDIYRFDRIHTVMNMDDIFYFINQFYAAFDLVLSQKENEDKVYKVEMVRDQYLVVSGLPSDEPQHASIMARIAIEVA